METWTVEYGDGGTDADDFETFGECLSFALWLIDQGQPVHQIRVDGNYFLGERDVQSAYEHLEPLGPDLDALAFWDRTEE